MPKDFDYDEIGDRQYDEYKEFMAGLPLWIKEQIKAMPQGTPAFEKKAYAEKLLCDKQAQNRAIVRSIWGGEINDD